MPSKLVYTVDKKKAEAKWKPLPPPPPSRRAGAKQKTKPMVGASTHQAEPSSTGPGKNGEIVSEERKRKQRSVSDPSIKPASKKNRQGLRPAGSGGPSYFAISANLPRVIVTFDASISERMEMTDFDHHKGAVMDKIVDIPEDGFVTRFRDTFVRDVVATFIYNYGESEAWLREAVPTIELGDGTLAKIVLPEELIMRINVTALVSPPRKEASQLAKLLARQNPELDTSKCRVL